MTYLAVEGSDGAGKSTQARILADRLGALLVREPGFTALGADLRRLLLDPDGAPVDARTETLLMAADRAQLMAEVIAPALAAGRAVVSDRSVHSSLAYQGGGRALGVDEVRRLNRWALNGRFPDLVVYLTAPDETLLNRLDRRLDRMEREGDAFRRRVADTYAALAAAEDWVVVPAGGTIDEVAGAVWAAVEPRLAG
ncbi:MAG: dTMP kinase [Acidimicrobiales bacterium]